MAVSRKSFVIGVATPFATAGFNRFPAGAAEFSYKLGTTYPTNHPVTVRMLGATAKIKAESNGRVEIGVFPNGQLGSDEATIAQARLGAIEFVSTNQVLQTLVPVVGVSVIPFAFGSEKEAWAAMNGPLWRHIRDGIVKANVNLYPLQQVWESGFRHIMNNLRPIRTADDLKGMKVRVIGGGVVTDTFKALGAIPVSITGELIYSSLQTHVVDGSDTTVVSTELAKYYEVVRYLSLTNHQWQCNTLLANVAAWERFPKNLRDIVERNFNLSAVAAHEDAVRLNTQMMSALQGHGLQINQADIPSFRSALRSAGLYTSWRDQFGSEAWALLERSVGRLA